MPAHLAENELSAVHQLALHKPGWHNYKNGRLSSFMLTVAKAGILGYTFDMHKSLEVKLSGEETRRIEAAIEKCNQALRDVFRRMEKDQAEINRLKAHTKKILTQIKAELGVA